MADGQTNPADNQQGQQNVDENAAANAANNAGQSQQDGRMFTQDELDKMIAERLKNVKKTHAEELAGYADYDDLKEKAAKYDELEEAKKSELEKANDAVAEATRRAEEAEKSAADLKAKVEHDKLVALVAKEEGVPFDLIKGDTEDEMRESAASIREFANAAKPKAPEDKGGGATPKAQTLDSIKAMKNGEAKMRALAEYKAANR